MIWFSCAKCNKTHGRPDTAAGTMIFCECGHGNRVPWDSTTTEPVAAPVVRDTGVIPTLQPVTFETTTSTGGPAAPASSPGRSAPLSRMRDDDEPPPSRRGATRDLERRDPNYCLNHRDVPRSHQCQDCLESFCFDCVTRYGDRVLCGPCKNFRIRKQELPAAQSLFASASLLLAIFFGFLGMCILTWARESTPARVFSAIFLFVQLLALVMGAWAFWKAERQSKVGGQTLALAGMLTSGFSFLLTLLLFLLSTRFIT